MKQKIKEFKHYLDMEIEKTRILRDNYLSDGIFLKYAEKSRLYDKLKSIKDKFIDLLGDIK